MEKMREMPGDHVQTCVTSPPYWGLRDYGVGGQMGLEKTPGEYVGNLVNVFREVRRVLKDDGTVWLNLGDSYTSGGRSSRDHDKKLSARHLSARADTPAGLKPKDLVGIPWRVAFALQADGWYLRQDIIWHKPNPMPESVRDRCTKAHEYIFLLSKSPKYLFDHEAIKEPSVDKKGCGNTRQPRHVPGHADNSTRHNLHNIPVRETRNRRSVWTVTTKPFKGAHFATFPVDLIEPCILAGSSFGDYVLDPFAGAGTTGVACKKHGRKFIGVELNPAYAEIARKRVEGER
jgi:DNA modification methylase